MQKLILFTITLCVVLSCQPDVHKALGEAEILLQQKPDSALKIMQSIDDHRLKTKEAKAYYSLLMSAALDKNYLDVSSDSLIKTAVDYYSFRGDVRRRMLSYYYYGIVQKNAKQYPAAILAFEKAEKEALAQNDHYQLGLVYRNKATIFSESNNIQEAINNRRKAVISFRQANAAMYESHAELALAIDYINNKDYDKADSLLVRINENRDDQNLVFRSNIRKAVVLICKGIAPEKAVNYYRLTPRRYYTVYDYGYYALALENLGQKDSADYWMSQGYNLCQNNADSASLDYMKSKIALRRGDFQEAYRLVSGSLTVQDSLTRILLQESVSGAQRDYYKAETARQEELLKTTRREKTFVWIIGLLFVLVCTIGFIGYSREKDRQIQEQIARLSLERRNALQLNKDNAFLLGSLLSARIEQLDNLSQEYFTTGDKKQQEVYFKQIKQGLASLRNNPHLYQSLENDLNQYCNGVVTKLRNQVPQIKGENLHLIILFFAGFPYEVVQLITNRVSIDSLKTARSRFRRIIALAKAEDEALFLTMLEMKKRPNGNTNENK